MSTKTTFKRIALVAVAALGLGVLSVAPSSATVSGLSLTVANGTAAAGKSDTATAATVTVAGLVTNGAADSITVTFINKDVSANTSAVARLSFLDTTTGNSITNPTLVSSTQGAYTAAVKGTNVVPSSDSKTASAAPFVLASGAAGYVGAKFYLQLDSTTASLGTAGVFTYTVLVSSYAGATQVGATSADVTITIAEPANTSKTVSAAKSFAFTKATTTATVDGVVSASDAVISGVSTAGSVAGYLYVGVRNADGTKYNVAQDSITVTLTGVGNICDGGTCGKSIKVNTTGDKEFTIVGDGSTGSASIVVSTTVNTYAAKSVTFNAKSPTAITTSNRYPNNLRVGTNSDAIQVTAVDGTSAWTSPVWIVASSDADALIAGSTTPQSCTGWTSANGTRCSITASAPGTAKFKVIDAATVATATTSSAEFSVTVTASSAASVAIAFDKASYQPFEKALITVTPLDAAGKAIQQTTINSIFASGGISTNIGFSGASDTITAVDISTSATTSSSSNTVAGARTYVVYMPASGDVTISATGGTGLPLAGQVKVSATASVVNSSVDAATDAANEATDAANAATDAALAAADAADAATAAAQDASDAVAALSATVAKLVASLKAQITSLTNLVIKIQKKVKA
jgi:hypothetical protein